MLPQGRELRPNGAILIMRMPPRFAEIGESSFLLTLHVRFLPASCLQMPPWQGPSRIVVFYFALMLATSRAGYVKHHISALM